MEAFQWVEGEIQVPEGKILVTAMLNGDGIATIRDAGAELTDGLHWEDENGFAVVVPSIKELTNIEYMTPSEARAASERQNEAIAMREPTQEEQGLMVRFNMTADQAREQARKNRESRREQWLETAIDPWAKKHGLSRMQAISVLFCDNSDGITDKAAYWAEANEFAGDVMKQANLAAWTPLGKQKGQPASTLLKAQAGIDVAGLLEDVLSRFNSVCSLATRLCHELEDHPDKTAKEFDTEELLHHSVSDYSTEIREELRNLVADLKAIECQASSVDAPAAVTLRGAKVIHTSLAGALEACMEQISQMKGMFDDEDGAIQRAINSGEAALQMHQRAVIQSPQKLVVVIEGGLVREVLSAQGGFSVAVIDYDKNADLDDMIVIPQGDGEKNAYALAAIHEPEVTPAARVDELYSAVVEAKPAAEDDDSPRMRC